LGTIFAQRLAARGHDLVLVARRLDRLEGIAVPLRDMGRQVETLSVDLAADGATERLMNSISAKGLSVQILINNAGYGVRGAFATTAEKEAVGMVNLNVRAVTSLARAVLPDMIARRSGGILNIASAAAFLPGPNMAVYYATKAFVLSLSESLHEEARPHGVRVTCLCPGATETEFRIRSQKSGTARFRLKQRRPEPVVEAGLAGLDANRAVVIPGLLNNAATFSVRLLPRSLVRRVVYMLQK
jgi:hypothetical protein